MRKILTALTTLLALNGCAYAIDSQSQEITFLTPGAENAMCFVHVNNLKYKTYPPQKIRITKADSDMRVDCLAPSNRRNEIIIKPKIAQSGYYNAANGGVGLPWDYVSGALFQFPDVVEVSFIGVEPQAPPIPAQNSPDIKQPEEYNLEEFMPGHPVLNSDRNIEQREIPRRQKGGAFGSNTIDSGGFFEGQFGNGKGTLQDVDAASSPTRLFPGQ